jgi:hypothetical protein
MLLKFPSYIPINLGLIKALISTRGSRPANILSVFFSFYRMNMHHDISLRKDKLGTYFEGVRWFPLSIFFVWSVRVDRYLIIAIKIINRFLSLVLFFLLAVSNPESSQYIFVKLIDWFNITFGTFYWSSCISNWSAVVNGIL